MAKVSTNYLSAAVEAAATRFGSLIDRNKKW